jgi:DNA-binding MarR family transcriptional regulator
MSDSPTNLTPYLDAPLEDVAALLTNGTISPGSPVQLGQLTSLILDRILTLLRKSARTEIVEEAAAFARVFDAPEFEDVQRAHPGRAAQWEVLSDLLSEAAHRSDGTAVESILRSYTGLPQRILEILAESDQPVPRASILKALELEQSYLSHILRDMEEAGLVIRERSGQSVNVRLGPNGREVVQQRLLPPWLDVVTDLLVKIHARERIGSADDVAGQLMALGASALFARRLGEALTQSVALQSMENAARFIAAEEDTNHRFAIQNVDLIEAGGSLRQLFAMR